jgi:hypothetical protein
MEGEGNFMHPKLYNFPSEHCELRTLDTVPFCHWGYLTGIIYIVFPIGSALEALCGFFDN